MWSHGALHNSWHLAQFSPLIHARDSRASAEGRLQAQLALRRETGEIAILFIVFARFTRKARLSLRFLILTRYLLIGVAIRRYSCAIYECAVENSRAADDTLKRNSFEGIESTCESTIAVVNSVLHDSATSSTALKQLSS